MFRAFHNGFDEDVVVLLHSNLTDQAFVNYQYCTCLLSRKFVKYRVVYRNNVSKVYLVY